MKKYELKHLHGYGLWAHNLATGKYVKVPGHKTISQLGKCWPDKVFGHATIIGDCSQIERCDNSFVASSAIVIFIINGAAIYRYARFPVKLARFMRS